MLGHTSRLSRHSAVYDCFTAQVLEEACDSTWQRPVNVAQELVTKLVLSCVREQRVSVSVVNLIEVHERDGDVLIPIYAGDAGRAVWRGVRNDEIQRVRFDSCQLQLAVCSNRIGARRVREVQLDVGSAVVLLSFGKLALLELPLLLRG